MVSNKGGSQRFEDPAVLQGNVAERLRLRYLDVPLLARVAGPRVASASLYGLAGVTLSLRLSAAHQLAVSDLGVFGVETAIDSEARRLDEAITIGAGADIGRRLVVEGRYSHGLAEVFHDDFGLRVKNRGFLLTVGARIF
jgi:hypothetical protein